MVVNPVFKHTKWSWMIESKLLIQDIYNLKIEISFIKYL